MAQNRNTQFEHVMRVISLSVKACGFATFLIRGRQGDYGFSLTHPFLTHRSLHPRSFCSLNQWLQKRRFAAVILTDRREPARQQMDAGTACLGSL